MTSQAAMPNCSARAHAAALCSAHAHAAARTCQHGHAQLQQAHLGIQRHAPHTCCAQLECAPHRAQLAGGSSQVAPRPLLRHSTDRLRSTTEGCQVERMTGCKAPGSVVRRTLACRLGAHSAQPAMHTPSHSPSPCMRGRHAHACMPTFELVQHSSARRSRSVTRPERYTSSSSGSEVRTARPSAAPAGASALPLPPPPLRGRVQRPYPAGAWRSNWNTAWCMAADVGLPCSHGEVGGQHFAGAPKLKPGAAAGERRGLKRQAGRGMLTV